MATTQGINAFQIHVPVEIGSVPSEGKIDVKEGLLNMQVSLHERMSLPKVRDTLKMMAKSEGGIGLEAGPIDFDHLAQLVHFLVNSTSGTVNTKEILGERIASYQPNLVTDSHMNQLLQRVILLQGKQTSQVPAPEATTDSGENNDTHDNDDYYEHDYEDEEQLYEYLLAHKRLLGNMDSVKK